MNITSITHMTREQMTAILDKAEIYLKKIQAKEDIPETLKGKVILNAFFEDSTRTRVSFEMAAYRLGAHVIPFSVASSSLKKGEAVIDTLQTLGAMHPDAFVVRATQGDMPRLAEEHIGCPVLNAGNGTYEHPTQALLDALTIRNYFGRLDGLRIAICGDIKHSRVAGSNILLLQKFGAELRLVGPEDLLPTTRDENIVYETDFAQGIAGADVVMMLRIQKERLETKLNYTDAVYFSEYGLTQERLQKHTPTAMVMHPGPMNREVEIAGDVADDPEKSLILKQVEAGVAVRMACLEAAILN